MAADAGSDQSNDRFLALVPASLSLSRSDWRKASTVALTRMPRERPSVREACATALCFQALRARAPCARVTCNAGRAWVSAHLGRARAELTQSTRQSPSGGHARKMGGSDDSAVRQRVLRGRICVWNSGTAYDVTDFVDRHPGGRESILRHVGQDLTQIMQTSPHKHSKAAYAILQKYRIGELDKQRNGLSKISENIADRQYFSTQDDKYIDWSKPILGQVAGLGERYFTWSHRPVDQPIRLFESDVLEILSKCPWWLVPLTWVPVTLYLLHTSYLGISTGAVRWSLLGTEVAVKPVIIPLLVACGILLWTFCEYSIHRWIFHWNPPATWPLLIKLHFVLHGQHHKSPMDRSRLVFPPVPASFFATAIFCIYTVLFPVPVAQALFAGTVLGYMAYDLIHYYIHHATPQMAYFVSLKRYHVKHHFKNQQLGFGISSKLWDYPFGTLIKDSV